MTRNIFIHIAGTGAYLPPPNADLDFMREADETPEHYPPGSLAWERDCVGRAVRGDTRGFEELVGHYAPRLFTHLFRILHNREETEDIVQVAFMRAYQSLHRYDGQRPFRNWLYTIGTNAAFNALRTRRRRGWTSGGPPDVETLATLRAMTELPETGLERVEKIEQSDAISEAINRLPPQAALLVQLHYQEGMTIREAAQIVGLSEGGARVALYRARKSLREWLVDDHD